MQVGRRISGTDMEEPPQDLAETIEACGSGDHGSHRIVKSAVKITYCNSAYAENWHKHLKRHSTFHFEVLTAVIAEISDKNGLDIVKKDIYERDPILAEKIKISGFDIVPTRGQLLKHNGNGIRHAKFSPSKNVAVIWEKIGTTIYVTFDDHAPIRYYRAIRHFRDMRLGRTVFVKKPRTAKRLMKKMKMYWDTKHSRGLHGIGLKNLYYE